MRTIWNIALKDLRIFIADRRALMISLLVPIGIASFIAMLTGNMASRGASSSIPILVADEDQSKVSKSILDALGSSGLVSPTIATKQEAMEKVRDGKFSAAVVVPKGFGTSAVEAMLRGGPRPVLEIFSDPSKSLELQAAQGTIIRVSMESVARAAFSREDAGKLPFELKITASKAAGSDADANAGTAHAFAGMAIQGLLFAAIEAAMGLMRDRQRGIWKRLRATPIPKSYFLLGRIVSTALRSLLVVTCVFAFGIAVFHFRVSGSFLGMALVAVCTSIMTASFGLFVAALGRSEQQSRGLSILAVLMMTMLGGAWFPIFLMPGWVQTLSMFIPVRWAVDGFDAMLWRGLGLDGALLPCAMLLAFALGFGAIAFARFRWDAEAA